MRVAVATLALAVSLSGCARAPERSVQEAGFASDLTQRWPILLITFEGLRSDFSDVDQAAAASSSTPNLAGLARAADWSGVGISATSDTGAALASLLTGLQPLHHGAIFDDAPELDGTLVTLADALRSVGYRTVAYGGGGWLGRPGYAQGFDQAAELRRGLRTLNELESWPSRSQFMWVHLSEPTAPYAAPPSQPRRAGLTRAQLERWFDPAVDWPPEERRRAVQLYRDNVRRADERLGAMLHALRSSGAFDDTLIVVTAANGEDLGEAGQSLTGGSLHRVLLEVPLVIKLPTGLDRQLAADRAQRLALTRLFATAVEVAGGSVPPASALSLFHRADPGVLSELYLVNGDNLFSWYRQGDRLLMTVPFTAAAADYYQARLQASLGAGERFETLRAQQRRELASVDPLIGRGRARLALETWSEPSRSIGESTLAQELERAFRRYAEVVPAAR